MATVLEEIAWVATAVGVILVARSIRVANLQRRRQFETIFVQRYWALIDQLSLDAQKGRQPPLVEVDDLTATPWHSQIKETDRRVVRSYLRLCEDELELRQEGWISRETWAIWQTGIAAQLERWPFKPIWCEVDQQTCPARPDPTVPEEFTLLRAFMTENKNKKDPLKAFPRPVRFRRSAYRLLRGAP
jgi:hypothetical protein